VVGYKDIEKKREYQRHWAKKRSDKGRKALSEILSKGCVACGENHPACLDFHHTDPGNKEFNVAWALRHRSTEAVVREAKKCIVLCANCHRKLHAGVG
jgi:hypothetical protein